MGVNIKISEPQKVKSSVSITDTAGIVHRMIIC